MKFDIISLGAVSDSELDSTFKMMNDKRRERCLRYRIPSDRQRMIAGEMLLRKLVAEEYGINVWDIDVDNLPSGKPVVHIKGKSDLQNVSISHSGDYVAAAISTLPVGIDIETRRKISDSLFKRALTEDERLYVTDNQNGLAVEDETIRFLRVWTAKEAYLKLTGQGLSGLKDADVMDLVLNKKNNNMVLEAFVTDDYVCTIIEAD